jgi:phospholipid transport system substrate-binding protein
MKRWLAVFLATGLFVAGPLALAGEAAGETPMELIQQSTEKVLSILNDKSLADTPKVREEKLWEVISTRFDFEEMSKRALALHWRQRSPQERDEFVPLFGKLLFYTYVDRIQGYSNEKVRYLGEEIQEDKALVQTKVENKSLDVPIEYRLMKKASDWTIYDVSIEGVSLINNYRNQFSRIITSDGYPELIERIKAKLRELRKEQSGPETKKN